MRSLSGPEHDAVEPDEAVYVVSDQRPAVRDRPGVPETVLVAGILIVGAWVTGRPLIRLDRFGINSYDEAAYFVGARALTQGYVPYRDFIFPAPPGILFVLAPFASLGSWGFTMAKIFIVGVGVASGALIWRIARAWIGPVGALLAALLYVVHPMSIGARRLILLEPLVTLAILIGVGLARPGPHGRHQRWRGVAVGFAFAAAVSIKYLAIVPLAAFGVAMIAERRRPSEGWRMLAGFTAGCISLIGISAALARDDFVRLTIDTQVNRPRLPAFFGGGPVDRLVQMAWYSPDAPKDHRFLIAVIAVVIGLLLITWGWTTTTFLGRLFATWLLFGSIALLASPAFYDHYIELIAAPFAMLAAGVITSRIHPGLGHVFRLALRGAQGAAALILLAGAIASTVKPLPPPFLNQLPPGEYAADTKVARRVIPVHDCVIADDPTVVLILPNITAYPVVSRGVTVDRVGAELAAGHEIHPTNLAAFTRSLSRCSWFVSRAPDPVNPSRATFPGWTLEMRRWFVTRFHIVARSPWVNFWRARSTR